MASNVRTPTGSSTVVGAVGATVVPNGSTYHAVLATTSDSDYVTTDGNPDLASGTRFILNYTPGTSERVDYLQPYFRQKYNAFAGWWYPARITGYVGSVPHTLKLTSASPGVGNYTSFEAIYGQSSSKASDGTRWSSCDRFEVEWWTNVNYYLVDGSFSATYWSANSIPLLSFAALRVNFTAAPIVGSISPTGTVTTPRPTITWYVGNGTQTSYRVMVIPSGAHDAANVPVGGAGFDPATSDAIAWDSGKVASSGAQAIVGVPLANGTYIIYVKAWIGSGSQEAESIWYIPSNTTTISVETVDSPTITLGNDSATYTVSVTVAPGSHVGGQQVASYIEVQYLHPTLGWIAAPIANSRVPGGTTSVFYDGLQAPGASVSYRARGVYVRPSDALSVVSAWVTASTTATNRNEWWLRSTTNYLQNRSLHNPDNLIVKDWKPVRSIPQSVTWGIGARAATITHDVVKSNVMAMSVWAMNATARTDLLTIIESGDDFILVTEWGEMYRVHVSDRIEEQHIKAKAITGETSPLRMARVLSFTLVEVVAP